MAMSGGGPSGDPSGEQGGDPSGEQGGDPSGEQGGDPSGEQRGGAYRVIVADDAAGMRELMRTLLSLEPDFEVVGQAGDGVEAVALVTALKPDLVVIDVSMPVMDGLQAIEQIRRVSPATRVAVLSGERRVLPEGADTHIEKGTPNEVVIATLRSLCQAGPPAVEGWRPPAVD
jgi:DNA-binding NarL/FixJ family response regulator